VTDVPPSEAQSFAWPDGERAALSLTFDDARQSQLDRGLPILDAHGVRATFYVTPENMRPRLDDWRAAVTRGHEIGNHTLTHPCSGNFPWSRHKALEECTLEQMEEELLGANRVIEELLGVTPTTFAYPCGETFVGRGEGVKSYVPLVARSFLVGRGVYDTRHNDPAFCDLAQVTCCTADGATFEELKELIDSSAEQGGWLILCSHEVGDEGRQTTRADTLEALCRYARDAASGIWVDTVATVGSYIQQRREGSTEGT